MIKNYKILAVIPARGGSKGIKDKNTIDLNGKPLIAYSIISAMESRYIDEVVVSTDSGKIADIASSYGALVPFIRPAHLADDKSRTIDVLLHAINELGKSGKRFDILVLLQPTQPLRSHEDINNALEEFIDMGLKGLVSVSPPTDSPILLRTINRDGVLKSLLGVSSTLRRQDMPTYYKVNGAIYINMIKDLTTETSLNDNPIPYIMPQERSVDIDEKIDLLIAECLLRNANEDI